MNLIEQIKVNDVSIDGYQGTYYSDNPEYVKVTTDTEGKILEGIKIDGSKHIAGNLTVDGSIYNDSLNKIETLSYFEQTDNQEWLEITTDEDYNIIEGTRNDGTKYIHNIESPVINDIYNKIPNLTEEDITNIKNLNSDSKGNILYKKTWYCCGDSFSEGDFSKSVTPSTSYKFLDGKYSGLNKVYSRFIALRNDMDLHLVARCGYTVGMWRNEKYYDDPNFDPLTMKSYRAGATTVSENISNVNCSSAKNFPDGVKTYTFVYDGTNWKLDNEIVDLSYYYITYTGTPVTGDEIIVYVDESASFFQYELPRINSDADYITLWFGINDSAKCDLGTIEDTTVKTFYGALNWSMKYLIENFPLAHIGLIVSNCCSTNYQNAVRVIAKKWGVPYLDLVSDVNVPTVAGDRKNIDVPLDSTLVSRWNNVFKVNPELNGHPNEFAHEYESTFIENWLRTL